ncbi:hypothetical protein [Desulfovibrio legallii]|uniref:hypothetical protein n=1 Tax=Desulfovibrio legallii TaxID=571438 RepID=UPI003A9181B3
MNKGALIAIVAIALFVGALALKIRDMRAENAALASRLGVAELQRDVAKGDARAWEKAAEQAQAGNAGLRLEADACLAREAEGTAMAEKWAQILNGAQACPMTESEKTDVPDAKTRDALAADLDRPL